MSLQLAVVVPTYNESSNIPELVSRLTEALSGTQWEVIFVDDDSPDGTAEVITSIAERDNRVRLLHRVGRRGLSSACVEGIMSTVAPFVAVMDADLQHDETVLPRMLTRAMQADLDLVIGSRHIAGGSMGDFAQGRVQLSNLGKRLTSLVCRTEVTDPMSGFFLIRAAFFKRLVRKLSQSGFKILVDILASATGQVKCGEVGYSFRSRHSGESKLDSSVLASYLYLLADQMVGRFIPLRVFLFCLVGVVGLLFHTLILKTGLAAGAGFIVSQAIATLVSMTGNYLLNNSLTFMDRKRRGIDLFKGLLIWYAACSVGFFFNLVVAQILHNHGFNWFVSGAVGISVAAFWNFGVTNVMIWRAKVTQSTAKAGANEVPALKPSAVGHAGGRH